MAMMAMTTRSSISVNARPGLAGNASEGATEVSFLARTRPPNMRPFCMEIKGALPVSFSLLSSLQHSDLRLSRTNRKPRGGNRTNS